MTKIKNLFYKIRPEEYLAILVFILVTIINTVVYPYEIGLINAVVLMIRYFTFGDPLYYIFFGTVCALAVLIFYTNILVIAKRWLHDKEKPSKKVINQVLGKMFEPIRSILPLWLVSGPMYLLLSNISYELRGTKTDILLSRADYVLIHKLLFVDLATTYNSVWFNELMHRSYTSLATAMGICLLTLLFFKKKYLLRVAITALVFSNIFAYPLYYLVPAQGPLYALIANKRNIDIPADVKVLIDKYNPSPSTKRLDEKILAYYANVKYDNSSPVSSFPSMHAMWAYILIYLFWKIKKSSIFLTIPWTFLVLTGGLYFSQHFFIDYIASIPLAILCIILAHILLGPERE